MRQRVLSKAKAEREMNRLLLLHAGQWAREVRAAIKRDKKEERDELARKAEWIQVQLKAGKEAGTETKIAPDTGEAGTVKRKYPDTGG